MKPKNRNPAARKRRKPDPRCFYGYAPAAAWARANRVRTADQGREPAVTYWNYERPERAAEGGPDR